MKFDAFGTSKHGEGKLLSKNFLLHLSAHWGDLIEQMKKICHNNTLKLVPSIRQFHRSFMNVFSTTIIRLIVGKAAAFHRLAKSFDLSFFIRQCFLAGKINNNLIIIYSLI